MSFKQYRTLDIIIFLLLYGVCEFGIIKAAQTMIDQAYVISLMLPILLIVMMRWSFEAWLQAIVSAILYVIYLNGDIRQMIIYVIGNLSVLIMAFAFKKIKKEKIRCNLSLSILYVVDGFILMEIGRFVATICLTQSFKIATLLRLMLTDSLSLVFALIVILITRKMDGLFMDQKTYLLNLEKEKKAEQSAYEN